MLHDSREYELSDAAWRELMDKEDVDWIVRCVDRFFEGAKLTARWIRAMIAPASDAVITFIACGGLEKNAEAAKIVRREYGIWLTTMPPIPASEVVEQLVLFYRRVDFVFQERGISV